MNKFFKSDPETRLMARLAGIALGLPLLLLCGYFVSKAIRCLL